ncbi:helix-turn-helix domain-containing protein [Bifidobacterium miconisargentati]|uniref:helix-turn-helix domain-containing protein n=1 Tax=Bifidobacterium miconisargentati TaxID=2834437 RepID=UPI001BDD6669|nr:hypothetical protein [Bifidobacterium miconisargentati]MBW3090398.1 helix-turn-helix domain-containing protein [Bifidobacterium miconisargentati]
MASRVEWTAIDHAAKNELAQIIDRSGLSLRAMADRMGGVISHVRVGDIHNGAKAPVRLSEFLAICEACNADPVQTLRRIIAEAERIQQQATQPTETPTIQAADYTGADGESLEETAAREQAAKERAMRKYRSGKGYAAYHDSHKYDPDPDIA